MYEESTYIGKLRQIKIQIFWTGNTAILTVWCFLITDWMRSVYFEFFFIMQGDRHNLSSLRPEKIFCEITHKL
jgi:hypothetical protein